MMPMLTIFIPFDRTGYGTMGLSSLILLFSAVKHLAVDDIYYKIRLMNARLNYMHSKLPDKLSERIYFCLCCCCIQKRYDEVEEPEKKKEAPLVVEAVKVDEEIGPTEEETLTTVQRLEQVLQEKRTKSTYRMRKPWH